MLLKSVGIAIGLANDRATFTFNQAIVVTVSGLQFSKLNVQLDQKFCNDVVNALFAIARVKALNSKREDRQTPIIGQASLRLPFKRVTTDPDY